MREIKFRAWKHVNTPEMFNEVQGINFVGGIVHLGYRLSSETVRTDKELLDNLILMQYTGLKDKNGTEIYEGDVLKLGFSGVAGKGYVYWCRDDGQWWIKDTRSNVKKRNKGRKYPLYQSATYEVIGNIYENPELLKD